ncbi:VWA domain-containing protein [Saccharopolyspora hordei]|uniref:VWA domain-containing protein n=1 Tax=Saccharopolyspora hordei TaxID=1838 RepID=A0A853AUK0_9PSEU|nr:VWA domain-containing protein [Saccharopolyspora hordei]NYI86353.1 hypothetical protein [Saccharopolyspora hordei]
MESAVHRFVRLLRLCGLRISVSEATDAMRCAAQPGMLGSREALHDALSVALVKDRRDQEVFDEVFAAFFSLRAVGTDPQPPPEPEARTGPGDPGSFAAAEEAADAPELGGSGTASTDIGDHFDPDHRTQRNDLDEDSAEVNLASMTDEVVFSTDGSGAVLGAMPSFQLETERLPGAGVPGQLAEHTGRRLDAQLSAAEERALLDWLAGEEDADETAAARGQLTGVLENLPDLLKRHLAEVAALVAGEISGPVEHVDEQERRQLEESLHRIAHSLRGARTSRHRTTPRGRVHPARTMRRNMRYDGVPFRPVTTTRAEDKPRLVVLTDVSLSVRSTARFTLHLVHGLQSLFGQVRTFAFVDEPVEITDLFADHPLERALGLVFDGLPRGGVLDVDGNSDYGATFGTFLDEHSGALDRRTTVLVLGDARGNGNHPNSEAFAEIARRVRETIWLTPEPRYSWPLGKCDLPLYEEHCDRVHVVRDLSGLERAARAMAVEVTGR